MNKFGNINNCLGLLPVFNPSPIVIGITAVLGVVAAVPKAIETVNVIKTAAGVVTAMAAQQKGGNDM